MGPHGHLVGGILKDLGSRKNPTTIAEVGLAWRLEKRRSALGSKYQNCWFLVGRNLLNFEFENSETGFRRMRFSYVDCRSQNFRTRTGRGYAPNYVLLF